MVILCELCEGGTLLNKMQKREGYRLGEAEAISVMREIVSGVKHMHQLGIAHRDLKVENILYQNSKYKICDFGSASTDVLDYSTASKLQISKSLESYEKYTTLMYRPPEMLD